MPNQVAASTARRGAVSDRSLRPQILIPTTVVSVLLFVAVAWATTELASVNPSFETGDYRGGWKRYAGSSEEDPEGHSLVGNASHGTTAAQVYNPNLGTARVLKLFGMGVGVVHPGDKIAVSFDARGSALDGSGGVAFAEFFTEKIHDSTSKSEILGNGPLSLNKDPNVWTSFRFHAIVGPDCTRGVTLQFVAAAGTSPASAVFDNISVVLLPKSEEL